MDQTDIVSREPLTEREVRVAGHISNRRAELRSMLSRLPVKGSLKLGARSDVTFPELQLSEDDVAAIIGLLIERSDIFLTSLGIELEE